MSTDIYKGPTPVEAPDYCQGIRCQLHVTHAHQPLRVYCQHNRSDRCTTGRDGNVVSSVASTWVGTAHVHVAKRGFSVDGACRG